MLFVCVHNAGRSQMAAGLVKLRSEGRVHVRSAGSDPGEEINPAVVTAMERARHRHARGVPEAAHRRGRPGRRRRDHDGLRRRLPDLSRASATRTGCSTTRRDRTSTTVRRIRDEIDARVQKLSNLRPQIRSLPLYPLSYGARGQYARDGAGCRRCEVRSVRCGSSPRPHDTRNRGIRSCVSRRPRPRHVYPPAALDGLPRASAASRRCSLLSATGEVLRRRRRGWTIVVLLGLVAETMRETVGLARRALFSDGVRAS